MFRRPVMIFILESEDPRILSSTLTSYVYLY